MGFFLNKEEKQIKKLEDDIAVLFARQKEMDKEYSQILAILEGENKLEIVPIFGSKIRDYGVRSGVNENDPRIKKFESLKMELNGYRIAIYNKIEHLNKLKEGEETEVNDNNVPVEPHDDEHDCEVVDIRPFMERRK